MKRDALVLAARDPDEAERRANISAAAQKSRPRKSTRRPPTKHRRMTHA
jgi:hypothetical protein